MVKKEHSVQLQKRDWVILMLFLAVIGTNWVWYQHSKSQEITNSSNASSWLMQQEQINKLKACIDEGTKPCELTPANQ
jgi:hypothetical protein